jgi:hypothetical protein
MLANEHKPMILTVLQALVDPRRQSWRVIVLTPETQGAGYFRLGIEGENRPLNFWQ